MGCKLSIILCNKVRNSTIMGCLSRHEFLTLRSQEYIHCNDYRTLYTSRQIYGLKNVLVLETRYSVNPFASVTSRNSYVKLDFLDPVTFDVIREPMFFRDSQHSRFF